jgi:hypothetical protein
VARYLRATPSSAQRLDTCFLEASSSIRNFDPAVCLANAPGREQYLVLGDSHAAQLYPGLAEAFPELDISEAAVGACVPAPGAIRPYVPSARSHCQELSDLLFRGYLLLHPVHTVVLAAAWTPPDLPLLGDTIQWIQAHHMQVVLVGPTVRYSADMPRILAMAMVRHNPGLLQRSVQPEDLRFDRTLQRLAQTQWHVAYISFFDDLCGAGAAGGDRQEVASCPAFAGGGVPLLFDEQHLTVAGSVLFAQAMRARHQLP